MIVGDHNHSLQGGIRFHILDFSVEKILAVEHLDFANHQRVVTVRPHSVAGSNQHETPDMEFTLLLWNLRSWTGFHHGNTWTRIHWVQGDKVSEIPIVVRKHINLLIRISKYTSTYLSQLYFLGIYLKRNNPSFCSSLFFYKSTERNHKTMVVSFQ